MSTTDDKSSPTTTDVQPNLTMATTNLFLPAARTMRGRHGPSLARAVGTLSRSMRTWLATKLVHIADVVEPIDPPIVEPAPTVSESLQYRIDLVERLNEAIATARQRLATALAEHEHANNQLYGIGN